MKHINIDATYKIVKDIYNTWDIASHHDDNDIKTAIEEAYWEGCLHGGMDRNLFNEALDRTLKEISNV